MPDFPENFLKKLNSILLEFENLKKENIIPYENLLQNTANSILNLLKSEKITYEQFPYVILNIIELYSTATDLLFRQTIKDLLKLIPKNQIHKLNPTTQRIIETIIREEN